MDALFFMVILAVYLTINDKSVNVVLDIFAPDVLLRWGKRIRFSRQQGISPGQEWYIHLQGG